MKIVKLTQGKTAKIDDKDFDKINRYKWYAAKDHRRPIFYAIMTIRNPQSMHRFLLKPPAHLQVDHINGDGLDNRRCNLRPVTISQQQMNSVGRRFNRSSEFKGITWHIRHKKWMARIYVDNQRIHLGYFTEEIMGALAYNKAAKKHFGEFARLNIL